MIRMVLQRIIGQLLIRDTISKNFAIIRSLS